MQVRQTFVLLGAAVIGAGLYGSAVRLVAQGKAVVWPAEAIKWVDSGAVPGAKQAVLWGDPTKGAYGALKSVPGGAVLPPHMHSRDTRVVVTGGSILLNVEGKDARMTVGSYSLIPGGMPHSATCQGTSTCAYLEQSDGAFDFTPVKR